MCANGCTSVCVFVCVSAGSAIYYFAKYMCRGCWGVGREWVEEPALRFVWGSFVKCHDLMMQLLLLPLLLLLLLLQLCRHLVGHADLWPRCSSYLRVFI